MDPGFQNISVFRKREKIENEESLTRFQFDKLKEMLTCPICLEILQEPVYTKSCSHRFCKDCIEKAIRQAKQKDCPLCRKEIGTKRMLRFDLNLSDLAFSVFGNIETYNSQKQQKEENFIKQNFGELSTQRKSGKFTFPKSLRQNSGNTTNNTTTPNTNTTTNTNNAPTPINSTTTATTTTTNNNNGVGTPTNNKNAPTSLAAAIAKRTASISNDTSTNITLQKQPSLKKEVSLKKENEDSNENENSMNIEQQSTSQIEQANNITRGINKRNSTIKSSTSLRRQGSDKRGIKKNNREILIDPKNFDEEMIEQQKELLEMYAKHPKKRRGVTNYIELSDNPGRKKKRTNTLMKFDETQSFNELEESNNSSKISKKQNEKSSVKIEQQNSQQEDNLQQEILKMLKNAENEEKKEDDQDKNNQEKEEDSECIKQLLQEINQEKEKKTEEVKNNSENEEQDEDQPEDYNKKELDQFIDLIKQYPGLMDQIDSFIICRLEKMPSDVLTPSFEHNVFKTNSKIDMQTIQKYLCKNLNLKEKFMNQIKLWVKTNNEYQSIELQTKLKEIDEKYWSYREDKDYADNMDLFKDVLNYNSKKPGENKYLPDGMQKIIYYSFDFNQVY